MLCNSRHGPHVRIVFNAGDFPHIVQVPLAIFSFRSLAVLSRAVCLAASVLILMWSLHQLRLSRLAAATSTTTDAIATSTTKPIAFMFRILLIPRRYRRFVIQFRLALRRSLPRCFGLSWS